MTRTALFRFALWSTPRRRSRPIAGLFNFSPLITFIFNFSKGPILNDIASSGRDCRGETTAAMLASREPTPGQSLKSIPQALTLKGSFAMSAWKAIAACDCNRHARFFTVLTDAVRRAAARRGTRAGRCRLPRPNYQSFRDRRSWLQPRGNPDGLD